jgi:hypothetical protein
MDIEKFIRENREEFDSYEPSNNLWANIENQLENQPKKGRIISLFGGFKGLKIAASILLFITIGYVAYRNNAIEIIEEHPSEFAISPTYATQLASYTSMIDDKREELQKLVNDDPQISKQFEVELKALNENYQHLRAELPKNPNQEDVLKAMIENLQWQTDLLNQQLNILQKIKNLKNEKANKLPV